MNKGILKGAHGTAPKGVLIGSTQYNGPSGIVTTYSTTSSSLVAVDAANLSLTFTATTDRVLLRAVAAHRIAATVNAVVGWLLNGATFGIPVVTYAGTVFIVIVTDQIVAVTPGQTYTLQLAFASAAGASSMSMYAGPPLLGTNNGAGPIVLEAFAA